MSQTVVRRAATSRRGEARRRISAVPRPKARGEGFEIRPEGVEFGVLDRLIGYAIRRVQILIYEDFYTITDETGITPPLFAALVLIAENHGVQQTRLGQIMGVARSGAMALVDRLEGMGLVERQSVAGDRRANSLVLTPKGRSVLADLTERIVEHDRRVSAKLTEAEKQQLKQLLSKF